MGHSLNSLPPHVRAMIKSQGGRRRNKYGVAPVDRRTWRGRTYDSKAEMKYARHLSMDPEVVEIIEQPRVRLVEGFDYRPDFLVIRRDQVYFVDVKGKETQRFRDVKRLWKAHGRLALHVVRATRSGFELVEVIEGGAIHADGDDTETDQRFDSR